MGEVNRADGGREIQASGRLGGIGDGCNWTTKGVVEGDMKGWVGGLISGVDIWRGRDFEGEWCREGKTWRDSGGGRGLDVEGRRREW